MEFIFAGAEGRRKSIYCSVYYRSKHNLTMNSKNSHLKKARNKRYATLSSLRLSYLLPL